MRTTFAKSVRLDQLLSGKNDPFPNLFDCPAWLCTSNPSIVRGVGFLFSYLYSLAANLTFRPSSRRQYSTAEQPSSSPISYYHHIGAQPLVYRTIGQQLERAARLYGDREAVVACAQHQRLTYAQVLEQADRLAAAFVRLGLRRGDRIGIWSPNSVEWYVSMMAAARAGLVTVALNPAYQAPEIGYCLKKVGMRAIYAAGVHKERSFYEVLRQVVPEIGDAVDGRVQSAEYGDLQTVVIGTDKELA